MDSAVGAHTHRAQRGLVSSVRPFLQITSFGLTLILASAPQDPPSRPTRHPSLPTGAYAPLSSPRSQGARRASPKAKYPLPWPPPRTHSNSFEAVDGELFGRGGVSPVDESPEGYGGNGRAASACARETRGVRTPSASSGEGGRRPGAGSDLPVANKLPHALYVSRCSPATASSGWESSPRPSTPCRHPPPCSRCSPPPPLDFFAPVRCRGKGRIGDQTPVLVAGRAQAGPYSIDMHNTTTTHTTQLTQQRRQ